MSTGKFLIKTDTRGQYRFNLVAANGRVILTSESYKAKASCMNGIDSVRTHAPANANYERKEAKNGQFMFNLKAANGEIIGTSETYMSTSGRDKGIRSVRRHAVRASVEEE